MQPVVKREILCSAETVAYQSEMLALYNNYYQVDVEAFLRRFESNDHYVLYRHNDKLVGFTGFRIKKIKNEFGRFLTIYIGQTVLENDFRGKSLIPRTCIGLIAKSFLKDPGCKIYVWCDALTFKPYLAFANSAKRFYPNRTTPNPLEVQTLLDHLGAHYYGSNYHRPSGTVHKAANVIKDVTTGITDKERRNPHIDFYAEANPNHLLGHGLLTIAPIDWKNFLYLIGKCLRKSFGL